MARITRSFIVATSGDRILTLQDVVTLVGKYLVSPPLARAFRESAPPGCDTSRPRNLNPWCRSISTTFSVVETAQAPVELYGPPPRCYWTRGLPLAPGESAVVWAIKEFIFGKDAEGNSVSWERDIGVEPTSAQTFRVTIFLERKGPYTIEEYDDPEGYWPQPNELDGEPDDGPAIDPADYNLTDVDTPPIDFWGFLHEPGIRVEVAGEEVRPTPVFVGRDLTIPEFKARLRNNYGLPAVLVARNVQFDTLRFLRDVAGYAHVYVASSPFHEHVLRRWLNVPLQDRDSTFVLLNPGRYQTPRPRPLRGPDERLREGIEKVVHWLQSSRQLLDLREPVPCSMMDIEIVRDRIGREHFFRRHAEAREIGDYAIAEHAAATTRLEAEQAEVERARRELDLVQVALKEARGEQLRLRTEREEILRAARDRSAAGLHDLEELPATLEDLIPLAERLYAHRLAFTSKARRAAKTAAYTNIRVAWECLRSMATVLYELHFSEELPMATIVKRYEATCPFALATGESESTGNRKDLERLRTDDFEGETLRFMAHVKEGRGSATSLRIHYVAHRGHRRLVIGHFGDHLPTSRKR